MVIQIPSDKSDINSYLIEKDGYVIIIDPGQGGALMEELNKRGYVPEYIFLTHEHFDHIENLEEVRRTFNVPVVASQLCSERIKHVTTNLSAIADILAYYKTGEIPEVENERFTCEEADITFEEKFEFQWRGHTFRFLRVPGHSPGSVLIKMNEDIVFTGDYLIYKEEEVLRLKGGSQEDFDKYTKPILAAIPKGTRIYPGHGPVYYAGMEEMPYILDKEEKKAVFKWEMDSLTEHHRNASPEYDRICRGLGHDSPFLPVTIFKCMELKSIPDEEVVRRVTSSGTSGQQVSQIFLDGETSAAQQRALCMITGDFIGDKRIPMLIIDSPDVLRDRSKFTARGAGIMGFSMMSSGRYYALTNEMKPDWEALEAFAEKAEEGPCFAFGFTYIIWFCLYRELKKAGRSFDFGDCMLIHGGGWKKLQNEKVSDREFKAGLKEVFNISRVSDYYGMAEQTGSIFMQCEEGHLHASIYSDIFILDYEDFSACVQGDEGLIALASVLPGSYPGHKLLTEDQGRILGEDDCPCGRKGKYFEISGRIKKAEVRGCSDTFEGVAAERTNLPGESGCELFRVPGGTWPPEGDPLPAFDKLTLSFLEELSVLFMKNPAYRQYPDIYALGFWCRTAHMQSLMRRQIGKGMAKNCKGKGLVLHIAPSNMPTMFAYSWITSLLAGCSNVVRMSGRDSDLSNTILTGILTVLERPEFRDLKLRNAFVSFPRGHDLLKEISLKAAARIIWGGDETVRSISSTPKAPGCIDIGFPDKYSIALLDAELIAGLTEDELNHSAHFFYNDTYGADQNACSSPKIIFWLKGNEFEEAVERWWIAVSLQARRYDFQPWMATEKYRMLCCAYAQKEGLGQVRRHGNRLYRVPIEKIEEPLNEYEANMGFFYEYNIDGIEEIYPYLNGKIQTIVSNCEDLEGIYNGIRRAGCPGVDRVVAIGEALDFDTIWDRKDIIDMLTE